MRITLLTWGTRGDVQPYAALGYELARRGHEVRLAVNRNHLEWARRTGFEIAELPLDMRQLIESDAARDWLARGKTSAFLRWLASVEHEHRRAINHALLEACDSVDAIVTSYFLGYRAASVAEKRGLRVVRAMTFPITPTAAYPSPYLVNGMMPVPFGPIRRWSHGIVLSLAEKSGRSDHDELRAELGLGKVSGSWELGLRERGIRTLHLFSERLLPRPHDWPDDHRVTGFCALPSELRQSVGEGEVPPEIDEFIRAGEAPVFFGFGSLPLRDPAGLIRMVKGVCRELGVRGLIGAGWTQYGRAELGSELAIFGTFDHDQVLPRCCAAVHHGGAGTTATVAMAGIPAVICSVFGDQGLWGHRLRELGVGTTFPFQSLDRRRLRRGLEKILHPDVERRARALGRELTRESGLAQSADQVEAGLS